MRERSGLAINGWAALVIDLCILAAGIWLLVRSIETGEMSTTWNAVATLLAAGTIASGFTVNPPNIARVVTFFGRYVGTVRRNGFVWTYPLTLKERVSLRVQNFDIETLKVNDANGNPIEVAAVMARMRSPIAVVADDDGIHGVITVSRLLRTLLPGA